MARMPGGAPKIEIPRWIQLVGLPLLLLLLWVIAGAARHAVFLFLIAALIALLLDPVVRAVGRAWLPRGLAVGIVYLAFAVVTIVIIGAVGTVVVNETRTAAKRVDSYFTKPIGQGNRVAADRDVDRLQHWLDDHRLHGVKIQQRGHKLVKQIREKNPGKYTNKVVSFVEGAAISVGKFLFNLVVVVVASIYMLLDFPRFGRAIDRRFPPRPGTESLLLRMEQALVSYVKGQALVSLIIGTSGGIGLWLFGTLGWLPGGQHYALLFGAWGAVTELIPYIGPWIGSIPPFIYAVVVHPVAAIWVGLLYLGIHQVEGHIVIPKVMGGALRLHPLLVIFGLLAGGEIYGLPGVLVALPLLAAARTMWEFFSERLAFERWRGAETPVPVEVVVEEPPVEPPAPIRR
jgi:predicted PurR-regulated permease PerM